MGCSGNPWECEGQVGEEGLWRPAGTELHLVLSLAGDGQAPSSSNCTLLTSVGLPCKSVLRAK